MQVCFTSFSSGVLLSKAFHSLRTFPFPRGKLRDTVLDWEDQLPTVDLERADHHSR